MEHAIKLFTEKYCGASITIGRIEAKMKYTHEIIKLFKRIPLIEAKIDGIRFVRE